MGVLSARLQALGIPFTLVYGVDGAKLGPSLLKRLRSRWQNLLMGAVLTEGELGCYLSHLLVFETFLRTSQSEYALVLEDDAALPEDLSAICSWLTSHRPTISFLTHGGFHGFARRSDELVNSRGPLSLYKSQRFPSVTACYLISREYARLRRDHGMPMAAPVDYYRHLPGYRKCHHVVPMPVQVAPFASIIGQRPVSQEKSFSIRALFREPMSSVPALLLKIKRIVLNRSFVACQLLLGWMTKKQRRALLADVIDFDTLQVRSAFK